MSYFLSISFNKAATHEFLGARACKAHVNFKPWLSQYWVVIHIHTFSILQVERILDLSEPGSNIILPSQNFSLVTKYKTLIYTKKHYILWQLYWCIFYDSGIWAHISGIWLIFYCNNIPPIIANSSLWGYFKPSLSLYTLTKE